MNTVLKIALTVGLSSVLLGLLGAFAVQTFNLPSPYAGIAVGLVVGPLWCGACIIGFSIVKDAWLNQ